MKGIVIPRIGWVVKTVVVSVLVTLTLATVAMLIFRAVVLYLLRIGGAHHALLHRL